MLSNCLLGWLLLYLLRLFLLRRHTLEGALTAKTLIEETRVLVGVLLMLFKAVAELRVEVEGGEVAKYTLGACCCITIETLRLKPIVHVVVSEGLWLPAAVLIHAVAPHGVGCES